MADIRVKKITCEPLESPLIIQNGDLLISNTTSTVDSASGAIVVNGGLGINSTYEASSNTAGGSMTVGGGVGVMKSLYVGKDVVQDTSTGVFRVRGLSNDRLLIDSSLTPNVVLRPDGVNTRLQLLDTQLTVNITAGSTNSSTGAVYIEGGVSVNCTMNATSVTQGGALTLAGGASIHGRMYVGEGISSINSNTIGNLFTTGGNIGIGTPTPNSNYALDVVGLSKFSGGITTGTLRVQDALLFSIGDGGTSGGFYTVQNTFGISNGEGWVVQDATDQVGIVLRQGDVNKYTTLRSKDNMFEVVNYTGGTGGVLRTDLCIATSGNIGVATTSPNYALDIPFGTVNALTYTGGSIGVQGGVVSDTLVTTTSITTGRLLATTDITTSLISADAVSSASVNVSVGVTTPTLLVTNEVATNISTGTIIASSGRVIDATVTNSTITNAIATHITNGSLNITNGLTTSSLLATGTSNLSNATNTVGCIVTTNGSVGVNTTSPSASVHVVGSFRCTSTATINATSPSINASSGGLVLTAGGMGIANTSDASSNSVGGALTVAGGASVMKTLYIGGQAYFTDTTPSTSYVSGAVQIAGGLTIAGNQNVANIGNGGALTVAGGASIGADLWVGGEINGSGSSSSTFAYLTLTATDEAINLTSGALVTFGGITIQATTNATSVTNGGSLLVNGGGSFNGDVYIGLNNFVYGSTNYFAPTSDVINFYDNLSVKGFSIDFSIVSNDFAISRYDTNGDFVEAPISISYSSGRTLFSNTTPSTSPSSSAVVIEGGVSINSTDAAVSIGNGGGMTLSGGGSIGKNLLVGGDVQVFSTTPSSTASSGALLVAGGVGISGNLNVLGSTIINGDLTIRGSTTTVQSNNTVLTDNVIILNSGPVSSMDSGIIVQRYQQDNNSGSGDVVNDSVYISDVLPLQNGVSSTQVKLSVSASVVDNYYNGWWVKVASGFSNNQVRKIIGYEGSSRLATISSAWDSQNPAIGDSVFLYNKPYVGFIYNEINDRIEFGASVNDPGQTNVTFTERLPIYVSSATCVSTQPATSSTAGGLIMFGGIAIANTSNAQSVTSGGTFTTMGGGSIAKTLYVGQGLIVNGVNMTPSVDDKLSTSTFNANNNQVSYANITGMTFTASTWGFDIYLAARLTATSNLYSNYHIRGVNKEGSWEIATSYVGDDMGLQFDITTGGQVRYSSANYAGFTSLVFKWKASVN